MKSTWLGFSCVILTGVTKDTLVHPLANIIFPHFFYLMQFRNEGILQDGVLRLISEQEDTGGKKAQNKTKQSPGKVGNNQNA